MRISQSDLEEACSKAGVDPESAQRIWIELEKDGPTKFNIENLAYYFGALIIMSAMGWLMTDAWDSIGGLGISFLGFVYCAVFLFTGLHLWFTRKLKIPGGLLVTIGVWMVPLIVFGIEKYTGLWPQEAQGSFHDYHAMIRGSWLVMEVATIVAGLVAIKFVRFPFLSFPIAFSLWYLSMDLTPILAGSSDFGWEQRQSVSVWFGLAMVIFSYFIDRRTKKDFAFWGYLFGMLALWGGLTTMNSDSELGKFIYCLINLLFIWISVVIQRRVFLVLGTVGVFSYLGYLAFRIFKGSLMFPIALSLLGIAIIALGVLYSKNREKIEAKLAGLLPAFLLQLNPERRMK